MSMAERDPYFIMLDQVLQKPEDYKVCLVCGNVMEFLPKFCPYCAGYRFEKNPDFVVSRALEHIECQYAPKIYHPVKRNARRPTISFRTYLPPWKA